MPTQEKSPSLDPPHTVAPGSAPAAIRAEGLYKVFGKRPENVLRQFEDGASAEDVAAQGVTPAVIDTEFEVRPGEIFVVMGLSGSGKSTLKISKVGRLTHGRRHRDICRAAGLTASVQDTVGSAIAFAAITSDGGILPPAKPGLGIDVAEHVLGEPVAIWEM